MHQVVELRYADENRDALFPKGLQDALRIDGIEKGRTCPAVKRCDEIHDQCEDVIEGQHSQKMIVGGHLNLLERLHDVAVEIPSGQHDPFGIPRGSARVQDDMRIVDIARDERNRDLFRVDLLEDVIPGRVPFPTVSDYDGRQTPGKGSLDLL